MADDLPFHARAGNDRTVEVRQARPSENATALSILEASLVRIAPADLVSGETLVAVDRSRILGVLVLDGEEVVGVAVRPRNRGQGVGTALMEAAARRRDCLEVAFEPAVQPFYESLGFDIESTVDSERLRGVRCR